jgi:D-sedoheptulose 7-phosphate isomerase
VLASGAAAGRLDALLAQRIDAADRYFAAEEERIALCCRSMAERFATGGRLLALGRSPPARSDARHVAVEFVHPVIVGKRALPALGLAGEGGPLPHQFALVAEAGDMAIAFEAADWETARALRLARERGCLTIADATGVAEWPFVPPTDDAFVRQELIETTYHVLWELVHVFFEHRGLMGAGEAAPPPPDAGAAGFLYPFLGDGGDAAADADAVLADVRRSIAMKAAEVTALRAQTLRENRDGLLRAAELLRDAFAAGGTLLALGDGGSATDAMDAVADLRDPPPPWAPRRALDLTEDAAILTAIGNDVGFEAVFARQVIAYGRAGDALLAFSTSGGSANVIAALVEARRRGLLTIALVGYDGGRIRAEGLADIVIVTRSEHIPRIQEAQASAWHALRELVEEVGA